MKRLVSLEFLTGYFCGLWFGTDPAPVTPPHSDPMFSALLQGNFGEAGPAGQQVSVLGIGQLWAEGNVGGAACCGGGGGQQTWTVPSIVQAGARLHTWLFFLITQGPPGPVGPTGIKGEKVSLGTFSRCGQGELPQRTLALIQALQDSPLLSVALETLVTWPPRSLLTCPPTLSPERSLAQQKCYVRPSSMPQAPDPKSGPGSLPPNPVSLLGRGSLVSHVQPCPGLRMGTATWWPCLALLERRESPGLQASACQENR